jgi:hypothetical protein
VPDSEILPVNFTISPAAKRAMERVKQDYDTQFADDPVGVLSVAWAIYKAGTPERYENVIIGIYPKSIIADVAHGIQDASGMKIVFFTTPEYHGNFAGKVLDHSEDIGFFLKSP